VFYGAGAVVYARGPGAVVYAAFVPQFLLQFLVKPYHTLARTMSAEESSVTEYKHTLGVR